MTAIELYDKFAFVRNDVFRVLNMHNCLFKEEGMRKIAIGVLLFLCVILIGICRYSDNNSVQEVIKTRVMSEGENVLIAVIDSGVNEMFIPAEKRLDFTDDFSLDDLIDHGTPIYNILKHSNVGIARKSVVFSLKVVDKSGFASMKALESALEWCIEKQVDIVNISLSYSSFNENVKALIDELIENNTIIVSSISNVSVEIDYPSMFDGVIAVGYTNKPSLYDTNTSVIFERKYFVESVGSNSERKKYVGNSVLTPVVTGIIACILDNNQEIKGKDDSIEQVVIEVKDILKQSGFSISD